MSSINNNKQQQLGRGLRNAGKIIVLFALPFAVYMINRGENVTAILMFIFLVILLPGCALYVGGVRKAKKAEEQWKWDQEQQETPRRKKE
jgi:hypothetical protein